MRRGFSLIELLIVIAIILIIITVAVPQYQKAQIFAREMAAPKAVQTAEIMYQSQYGTMPVLCVSWDRPTLAPQAPPRRG